MIDRPGALEALRSALVRAPVAALIGPRQCGKTTLARCLTESLSATWLDLEAPDDLARLANPQLYLGSLRGLVVLDDVQVRPDLFGLLRVLADRPDCPARFLLLGSASPTVVRGVSESLAGRIEFVELGGLSLREVGAAELTDLWVRGGFPRSLLATSAQNSLVWRHAFVQTFLERDVLQLGWSVPPVALRRFWTMLAHWHGQLWRATELGRSLSAADKTVRRWLDLLTGAFLVRQLPPWHANLAKRQVRAPKVYVRDSGLLHALLGLPDYAALLSHPAAGASWEAFCIEQVLDVLRPGEAYFWATHAGAEIDLVFPWRGRQYGVEVKLSDRPQMTRSLHVALADLAVEHIWVVHPGQHRFPLHEQVTAWPAGDLSALRAELPD